MVLALERYRDGKMSELASPSWQQPALSQLSSSCHQTAREGRETRVSWTPMKSSPMLHSFAKADVDTVPTTALLPRLLIL